MQVVSKRRGKVTLVGAGPGDPELITLKGLRALERAEVVVYDRLAPIELLQHLAPPAERICVGKRGGHYGFPQERINALLRDRALQGFKVVRLKGGDPFLFGRGGEEVQFLRSERIEVEVIPGVSAALAAPASAGIPLTHRGVSSSVTIVSGHRAASGECSADLGSLGSAGETLVILMPLGNLKAIVRQLLQGGRPLATPVAVIQSGTRTGQKQLVTTLRDLISKVEEAGICSPALLVVGSVAELAQAWVPELWWEQQLNSVSVGDMTSIPG